MAGSDSFVSISEGHVPNVSAGWVNQRNLLVEQFDRSMALADSTNVDFQGYSQALYNLILQLSLPNGWDTDIDNVIIGDVSPLDFANVDAIAQLTLPGFDEVIFPILPALQEVPAFDNNAEKPVKPLEINPTLGYSGPTPYNSQMWLDLFTTVHNGLMADGVGLGAEAEQSLYERDRFRKVQANEDMYESGLKQIASSRNIFPQMMVLALQVEVAKTVNAQDHASSNEITIAEADRIQKDRHFMIESSLNFEKISHDWENAQETLTLDAKKAAAELLLSNYAEMNKGYVAHWSGYISDKESQVAQSNAIIAANKNIIDGFRAQSDGSIAQTDQISKERESLVDNRRTDAIVYEAQHKAIGIQSNAETEKDKVIMEKARLEIEREVQKIQALISGENNINNLRAEILKGLTNASSSLLSATVNSVNTSVGHSTSKSESLSESYTHGDRLTSSHNHDEAVT